MSQEHFCPLTYLLRRQIMLAENKAEDLSVMLSDLRLEYPVQRNCQFYQKELCMQARDAKLGRARSRGSSQHEAALPICPLTYQKLQHRCITAYIVYCFRRVL